MDDWPDALDPDADPEAVARSIALRRLAARDRTRAELAQAMRERSVPSETAERVLDRLADERLVDDQAFAERWVESRRERRHRSRRALRHELAGKGVDPETVDAALAGVSDTEECAVAEQFARRRLSALSTLPSAVRYRRMAGALARRGFPPGVVSKVLREVLGGDPD